MQLHRSINVAALAAAVLLPLGASQAAGVAGQGTWETTLLPRDINGDGTVDAFYDTVLNVSWLADANAAVGSVYVAPWAVGGPNDGQMNWANAKAWVTNLDVYGNTGWRLPTMIDTGAPGCDWSYTGGTDCGINVQTISPDGQTVFSEMAHLYYVSLGNKSICTPGDANCNPEDDFCDPDDVICNSHPEWQPGWGLSNTGGFRNLRTLGYWSGVAYAPYPTDFAWGFNPDGGYQEGFYGQNSEFLAMAVRLGDVTSAVPEPQTYAMMLLGLLGVVVFRRRENSRFGASSLAQQTR